jgi:hypothetical protein
MFEEKKETPSIGEEIGAELPYPKYMLAIEDKSIPGGVFRAFFPTPKEAEEFYKQKGSKGGKLTLQENEGKSIELVRDFGTEENVL